MSIIRKVNEGACYPSIWWGFCWFEWHSRSAVIAPIGLNVIVAAARWCLLWTQHGITGWMDRHEPPTKRISPRG